MSISEKVHKNLTTFGEAEYQGIMLIAFRGWIKGVVGEYTTIFKSTEEAVEYIDKYHGYANHENS